MKINSIGKGLILLSILNFSCSSTKYTAYSSYPKFLASESILVLPINELNTNTSFELFEIAAEKLETPMNRLSYLPEVEYDLIKKGIGKEQLEMLGANDSINHLVSSVLNVDHILDVRLTRSNSSGTSFGSYTELELNEHNSHYYMDNEARSASLLFTFTSLKEKASRKFLVSTTINPMNFDDKDGGETRVNLATLETAIQLAYTKGIKKIKKGMITKK